MSTKTTVFPTPTNYWCKPYHVWKSTDTAVSILRDPRRLSWYKEARRKPGEKTEFMMNLWICPHCGASHPEYHDSAIIEPIDEEEIEDFFNDQTSLFDHDKRILIQDENSIDRWHVCRKCEKISTSDAEPILVLFQKTKTRSKNELKVMVLHVEFTDLFTITGLTDFQIEDADPGVSFTESVVFNFNRGTTFLTLQEEDHSERVIAVRDITNSVWSDGPVVQTIFQNPRMNRHFFEQFSSAYPGEIPFSRKEMSPMRYVQLCRFLRFPKTFYDSIPYSLDSAVALESSYRAAARKLHTIDRAISSVNKELPYGTKQIRRILFSENPGLLFFIPELKAMAEVLHVTCEDLRHMKRYAKREESQIQDLANHISRDLFAAFLKLPTAVPIAAEIREYPGIKEFLQILLAHVGPKRFLSLLEHSSQSVFDSGERFAYASPRKKKEILEDGFNDHNRYSLRSSCSELLPKQVNGDLKESWIGEYHFKPVTYKQEYSIAAKALHNCLKNWCYVKDPSAIVVVSHHFKIVAAIEVRLEDNMIVQARLAHNLYLNDQDTALKYAYKKWVARENLREEDSDF